MFLRLSYIRLAKPLLRRCKLGTRVLQQRFRCTQGLLCLLERKIERCFNVRNRLVRKQCTALLAITLQL